jgi:cell division protein WhiA
VPLSDDVRRELAAIEPRRDCDRLAELSGLFHTAGSLHLRAHGEFSVHLDVGEAAVARRSFALLRAFGVEAEIRTYAQHAFGRPTRYQIHVPGGPRPLEVLHRAGVLSAAHAPLEAPPVRVVGRACCRHAYVRGAFLGGGSVSGPRSPHLEIRTASRAGADLLAAVAAQDDVVLRIHDRGRYASAYAKGAEAIADVLALAGAGDAALALDEHAVVAEARAHANRVANADHANLVRSGRAAHRQIGAIRELEADGRLARLAPSLQEIAELRQRYPSASLRELAAKCRPPATKAAVHRRLARLVALADDGAGTRT